MTIQRVIARAGHMPPVLVCANGNARVLDLPPGLPLGIGGAEFSERELTLPAESTLTLYTDGLVESRERDIDTGLAALQTSLAERYENLEDAGAAAIEALRPCGDRDDIAAHLNSVLIPSQHLRVLRVHKISNYGRRQLWVVG